MSAADDIVLAIRVARASGASEAEVAETARRLADQYPTRELEAAQAQLEAELRSTR